MYLKYAERNRLRLEVVDASETGIGGYREVIALLEEGRVRASQIRKRRASCPTGSHYGGQRRIHVHRDGGGDAGSR